MFPRRYAPPPGPAPPDPALLLVLASIDVRTTVCVQECGAEVRVVRMPRQEGGEIYQPLKPAGRSPPEAPADRQPLLPRGETLGQPRCPHGSPRDGGGLRSGCDT
mmetsp:Transcript_43733/g.85817  ORF Transcript_43733/g.85817 Transcript_43733/m.85817 type:complete len:105 (+) Transcript_43733:3-317(+)